MTRLSLLHFHHHSGEHSLATPPVQGAVLGGVPQGLAPGQLVSWECGINLNDILSLPKIGMFQNTVKKIKAFSSYSIILITSDEKKE